MTTTARTPQSARVSGTQPVVALRDVFCVHRTGEGDAAALQGTNLDVAAGELVCILGPSGAGKSTLLRVIAGLQTPSAGIVHVLGADIGRLSGRARSRFRHQTIGFLGQHSESMLAPELPAADAIARPLALRGSSRRAARRRAAELLSAAGLTDRATAVPAELSGGERQRVALCAALAHQPPLLLADEPTGELDPASARAVRSLLAELARAAGTTVIVVSHDSATDVLADRSVLLRDGRVVQDARTGEDALVVTRGGWVQLPSDLLSAAGIGERAHVRLGPHGVVLTPARGERAPAAPAAGPSISASPSWEPATVELRSLSRRRGPQLVIDGLTRRLKTGGLTAVIGASGVGKTTLLRMLVALDRPDAGALLIDSEPVGLRNAEQLATLRRERIGYLPQEPAAVGFLSAEENVALALSVRSWSQEAAVRRAAVILSWLGLSERSRQRVSRLSAGETQRVALGRALAGARGLLVVDEPTSRLDRSGAADVAELLVAASRRDGQTVVCATHDVELISRADDVIELGARST